MIQMQLSRGKILMGGVQNSPYFGKLVVCVVALLMTVTAHAQNLMTKVYRQNGTNGNYYGKLHIPKGGKYHIAMYPRENVIVGVFRAHIDGQYIYLGSLDPYGGEYWIDASEVEQNFLVRNSDGMDIVAVPVTAEDEAMMKKKRWFFYGKTDALRNNFNYTATSINNETLRTSEPFAGCPIYVMANPAKYGLSFVWLNQNTTTNNLPAGSLYVLGEEGSRGRIMNVVFEDEPYLPVDETTAIQDAAEVSARTDDGDEIYTLQGVRVTKPKKGGLYIRNGKKYIAR